jgi:hypothetical protein
MVDKAGNYGDSSGDIARNEKLSKLQKTISRGVDELHASGDAEKVGGAAEAIAGPVHDATPPADDSPTPREDDGRFAPRERERGYDFGKNLIPPPTIQTKEEFEKSELEAAGEPKDEKKSDAQVAPPADPKAADGKEASPAPAPDKPVDPAYFEGLTEARKNMIKKFVPGNDLLKIKTDGELRHFEKLADEDYWRLQKENATLAKVGAPPIKEEGEPKQAQDSPDKAAEKEPSSPETPEPLPDHPAIAPYKKRLQSLFAEGEKHLTKAETIQTERVKLESQTPALEVKYKAGELTEEQMLGHYRRQNQLKAAEDRALDDFAKVKEAFDDVDLRARERVEALRVADGVKTQEQVARQKAEQEAETAYNTAWLNTFNENVKVMKLEGEDLESYKTFVMAQTIGEAAKTGEKPDPVKIVEAATKEFARVTKRNLSESQRQYAQDKAKDAPKAPAPPKAPTREAAPAPEGRGRRSLRELQKMVSGADI